MDEEELVLVLVGRFITEAIIRRFEANQDSDVTILLGGFSEKEIFHALKAIDQSFPENWYERGCVVVSGFDPMTLIPERFRLSPDKTLTSLRNDPNMRRKVLFSIGAVADQTGLDSLHRLEDSGILKDWENRDILLSNLKEIYRTGLAGQLTSSQQKKIIKFSVKVFERISGEIENLSDFISLRSWILYMIQCIRKVSESGRDDGETIKRIGGKAIVKMGFLPDSFLFEGNTSALLRRLRRNANIALRRNPSSGNEIELERYLDRIDSFERHFDPDGALARRHEEYDAGLLTERMKRYVESHDDMVESDIEYELWNEIFNTRTQTPLGDQVRSEIEAQAADYTDREFHDPVEYFDGMDVQGGLNDRDVDKAITFVEYPSLKSINESDSVRLVNILETSTKKKILKLADSRIRTGRDALLFILKSLFHLDANEMKDGERIVIDLLDRENPPLMSLTFFKFLYGMTLRDISERVHAQGKVLEIPFIDEEGLVSSSLNLTYEKLKEERNPPSIEDIRSYWKPLEIQLLRKKENGENLGMTTFEWEPPIGMAAIPMSYSLENPPDGGAYTENLSKLCEELINPDLWSKFSGKDSGKTDLSASRDEFGERAESEGLSIELIGDYVSCWSSEITKTRIEQVPQHTPNESIDTMLDLETLSVSENESARILLASNPFYLQWFATYLSKYGDWIRSYLTGENPLDLNNESMAVMFFDWLEGLSDPVHQPPILVSSFGKLHLFSDSLEGNALYVDQELLHGANLFSGSSVDQDEKELVRILDRYIDTYPQCIDGLNLLVWTEDGQAAATIIKALERILKENPELAMLLQILAPMDLHSQFMEPFEERLGAEDPRRILPGSRLVFHTLDPADPDTSFNRIESTETKFDILIASHVFTKFAKCKDETVEDHEETSKNFDPFWDPAIQNISHNPLGEYVPLIKFRPYNHDRMFADWSTLNQRRNSNIPRQADHDKGAEYFYMNLGYNRAEKHFRRIHDLSRWVVSIDKRLDRDQIDKLPEPPDIIHFDSGDGTDRKPTTIVSSHGIKHTIIDRIEEKLNLTDDPSYASLSRTLSETIYENARKLVPDEVLSSLGVGNKIMEISGSVVSRNATDRTVPGSDHHCSCWLSLDRNSSWFGGSSYRRADMVRMDFKVDSDRIDLDITVVESKFGKSFNSAGAEDQLQATMEFFDSLKRAGGLGSQAWRVSLEEALRQLPFPRGRPEDPIHYNNDFGNNDFTKMLSRLRTEEIQISSIKGMIVVSGIDNDQTDEETLHSSNPVGNFRKIKLGRKGIVRAILGESTDSGSTISIGDDVPSQQSDDHEAHPPEGIGRVQEEDPEDGMDELVSEAVNKIENHSDFDHTEEEGVPIDVQDVEATSPIELEQGMTDQQLRELTEKVTHQLSNFGITVYTDEDSIQEGPGFVVMRLRCGDGIDEGTIRRKTNALKLALELEREQEINIFTDKGYVVLEVPKTDEQRYFIRPEKLWENFEDSLDELVVPIGIDISNKIVSLNFSSPSSPHLLVAGTTGSGKSIALETILDGLNKRYPPERLKLGLVDPKRVEMRKYHEDPHLLEEGKIYYTSQEAIDLLEKGIVEMNNRYEKFSAVGQDCTDLMTFNSTMEASDVLPWYLIVLEEYANLTSERQDKIDIENSLKKIAQMGRAAGIHLIVATQKPIAEVISTTIRSNLPARIALKVTSRTDSSLIIDEGGAESLNGKGDAIVKTGSLKTRLQIAGH